MQKVDDDDEKDNISLSQVIKKFHVRAWHLCPVSRICARLREKDEEEQPPFFPFFLLRFLFL